MNRKSVRGRRRVEFLFEAVGLLLFGAFLMVACSGCSTADAGIVTEADRALVASELAFVSLNDGGSGVVWRPLDDAKPTPAPDPAPVPRPFTGSKTVAITNGAASRIVDGVLGDPVDISYSPACADGSCGLCDGEFGDRPRPVVRAVGGIGRGLGALGRGINRARPIRRIGGFLFRRRCG